MLPEKKHDIEQTERRQFVRIRKNYIIRFYVKSNPSLRFEMSQVENISKGGICFTSTVSFSPGDVLAIELRAPYVVGTVFLEGKVLSSKEVVKGLVYANRLKFDNVSPDAADVLDKIEQYNLNKADKG